MAALVEGTDYVIKRVSPMGGITQVVIRTTTAPVSGSTIVQTLTKLGIGPKGFIGIIGFVETTANSVYAQEAITTSVTTGSLTLTIPAGNDSKRRIIILFGQSLNP